MTNLFAIQFMSLIFVVLVYVATIRAITRVKVHVQPYKEVEVKMSFTQALPRRQKPSELSAWIENDKHVQSVFRKMKGRTI